MIEDTVIERILKNDKTIRLVKGDITERKVDVIVNAANSYLNHGGGVAAAIVKKGGKIIQEESNNIDFVSVGSSVITSAGKLPCRAIIHTVGPMRGEGNEDEKLVKAINGILELATHKSFQSVSIPAISSGIFGFPKNKCAKILVKESVEFFQKHGHNSSIEIVEFCMINDDTLNVFQREMELLN